MEHKFEIAKKVIEIVSTFDGCVYGSFVKDVIVPRMDDPKCEISFDNINVWFKSSFSRTFTMEKLRENFRGGYTNANEIKNNLIIYKILNEDDKLLFSINFVVSFDHPDKKFDINYVGFKFSNDEFKCIHFEHLIDKIRSKKATIVKTYFPNKDIEFEEINKDFFEKGWTVSSKQTQALLSKWFVKNDIHVLISYENEHWNYCPTKVSYNESEYKIDIAKKILTFANAYDGKIYGGFVRDVIIPRINDLNCTVSFKDIDIWFSHAIYSKAFINSLEYNLKIEKGSFLDRDLDYSKTSKDSKFSRRQYRIYSENGDKFLFHIDVITSDKLPVNDFFVNTITYNYINNEFVKSDNCDLRAITNKIAMMFGDYNPVSPMYYERINRIFFSKGWTVRCKSKHQRLSDFVKKENLDIKEIYDGVFYDYIPENKSKENNLFLKTIFNVARSVTDDYLKNSKSKEDKSKEDENKKIKLILSIDSIETRTKNRFFVSVSSIKRFPCRFLSGALRSWAKCDVEENTRVFILPLRITGTPENIRVTLKLYQYTEEEINNYLKDAITKDNYQTTKSEEYKEEISAWKKIRIERIEKAEKIRIDNSKDDISKDIMKSIFNLGLEVLEEESFNNIKDEKLRYIYKIGLDEYRKKFNSSLKEM